MDWADRASPGAPHTAHSARRNAADTCCHPRRVGATSGDPAHPNPTTAPCSQLGLPRHRRAFNANNDPDMCADGPRPERTNQASLMGGVVHDLARYNSQEESSLTKRAARLGVPA